MTELSADERRAAASALRATVRSVEAGEVEGDAFTRGYLLGAADTVDVRAPEADPG